MFSLLPACGGGGHHRVRKLPDERVVHVAGEVDDRELFPYLAEQHQLDNLGLVLADEMRQWSFPSSYEASSLKRAEFFRAISSACLK